MNREEVCSLRSAEAVLIVRFRLLSGKAEEDHDKRVAIARVPAKVTPAACSFPRHKCVYGMQRNITGAFPHKILWAAEPSESINNRRTFIAATIYQTLSCLIKYKRDFNEHQNELSMCNNPCGRESASCVVLLLRAVGCVPTSTSVESCKNGADSFVGCSWHHETNFPLCTYDRRNSEAQGSPLA